MAGGAVGQVGQAKGPEPVKLTETPPASDSAAGAASVPEPKPAKGRASIGIKTA
eukprot:CAMPEP_0184748840 /NCGR_PEP_ID=MMETSP0315-20130426/23197_1 /TAXON_ID=101924 /ORGANISM="Rhodosorus marinus, Strain UTEX LB 2760" /LENGTH=53 /DNA_ID=CAMNT_0027224853 /DNA_START=12 /DNA_END=169 /DNA_ORIENTATION=+